MSTKTNNNISSTQPHETPYATSFQKPPTTTEQQGSAAPSYVQVPSAATDPAGPKGTNLTEDDGMTGRPGKFNVEVGSNEDPSREALRTMRLKQTRGAPGTGEREVGEQGKDEQPYATLGGETSA